jgi:hypothetical protein
MGCFFSYSVNADYTAECEGGSATGCGTGSATRYRECMNSDPSSGGRNCSGEPEEHIECSTVVCPGMPELSLSKADSRENIIHSKDCGNEPFSWTFVTLLWRIHQPNGSFSINTCHGNNMTDLTVG